MSVKLRMLKYRFLAKVGGPGTVFEADEKEAAALVAEGYCECFDRNQEQSLILKNATDRQLNPKSAVVK